MAHYIGAMCKHPTNRCWRREISQGGAFSLSLAGAWAVELEFMFVYEVVVNGQVRVMTHDSNNESANLSFFQIDKELWVILNMNQAMSHFSHFSFQQRESWFVLPTLMNCPFTTRFDSSTFVLVCGLVDVLVGSVRSLLYYDSDWWVVSRFIL